MNNQYSINIHYNNNYTNNSSINNNHFTKKKSIIDKQKISPFECGFNPLSFSRIPFSIHFFIIRVLFLIFDIEIIIILPIIITIKSSILLKWLYTSITIIIILLIGLYHEWNNGLLNWTK